MTCAKRFGRADRFCSRCGAARPIAAVETADGATARLERRHLTVLFCDLVGSTELSAVVDPEELAEIILAYRTLMQARVAAAGGTVSQYVGDGIAAYFGFPQAQDDDAARAVGAALTMLRSMPLLNERFASRLLTPLRIRIGVRSGLSLVELADTSGPGLASVGAIGQAPNIAARLQALAEPDTILVSGETLARTSSLFFYEAKGEVSLKGVPGKVAVFRPVRERRHADNKPTTDGPNARRREIASLEQHWQQTVAGTASRVLITGEAGLGKSFVADKLTQSVRRQNGLVLRFGGQFDAGYSPFRMVLDGLQRYLRLGSGSPPARAKRLQRVLGRDGQGGTVLLPLLCEFLSLPLPAAAAKLPQLTPSGRRLLLQTALFDGLCRIAARRPVLLVVENGHWLDPSSEEWLTALTQIDPSARVMLVVTARPVFGERWDAAKRVDRIVLDRLDEESLYAILDGLDQQHLIGDRARRAIIERSDGVPLFLEELYKHVIEFGTLVEDNVGKSIPDSLRSMLAARLDRLGPAKPIALAAAVIGRHFWLAPLQTLLPRRTRTIAPGLALLIGANIIEPGQSRGAVDYSFRHAMLRDAAYESLLTGVRRAYHAQLARNYAKFAPDIAEAQPEIVATHASLGGLGEQAVALWTTAGSRALDRSLYKEAQTHFQRALEQADALRVPLAPGAKARLLMNLAVAMMGAVGFASPEVEHLNLRAHQICLDAADQPGLTAAIGGLTSYYQVRGPLDRARALAVSLVETAEASGDEAMLIRAKRRLGWCCFCMGELAEGRRLLEEAVNHHEEFRIDVRRLHPNEIDAGVIGYVNLGWAECFAGNTARGLSLARLGLDLAHRLGQLPADMAYALSMSAAVHQVSGDDAETFALARQAQIIATNNALPYFQAWSTVLLGSGRIRTDPAEAVRTILTGIAAYRRTGARLFVPYNLGLAADALRAIGRERTALMMLDRGLKVTAETGARFSEARLIQSRAEVLAMFGHDHGILEQVGLPA